MLTATKKILVECSRPSSITLHIWLVVLWPDLLDCEEVYFPEAKGQIRKFYLLATPAFRSKM